jgi:hypothetical protein
MVHTREVAQVSISKKIVDKLRVLIEKALLVQGAHSQQSSEWSCQPLRGHSSYENKHESIPVTHFLENRKCLLMV